MALRSLREPDLPLVSGIFKYLIDNRYQHLRQVYACRGNCVPWFPLPRAGLIIVMKVITSLPALLEILVISAK